MDVERTSHGDTSGIPDATIVDAIIKMVESEYDSNLGRVLPFAHRACINLGVSDQSSQLVFADNLRLYHWCGVFRFGVV